MGKSRHSCLVSDLRGNVFSFSVLSMMLAGVCYCGLYSVELGYVEILSLSVMTLGAGALCE